MEKCKNNRHTYLGGNTLSMHVLGIDIGGTKIAAGVVSSSGELLSFLNQPTPTVHNSEQLYEAIVALANNAIVNAQLTQPIMAVGAGCGGRCFLRKGFFLLS